MRKLLPVFAFLLIIQCCLAKEVKTVTVFGGFLSSVTGGVIYSKHFDFNSPDGFSKAYYVKARIILDTLYADTTIYMTLNGTYCNPRSYNIPNAESRYLIEFSCTDAFKGEGTYEVKFYSTKDVKNLYAEWEITYLNNPEVEIKHVYKRVKARMIVKGTDYVFGETAKVFLQLLKDEQPVNKAICLMDLYDPNNTRILDDVVMPYLNGSDGLYYYEYKIPPVQGVYMLSVKCLYLVNYTMDYADAFNLLHGDLIEGTYEDTWNEDRIYHTIQEVSPDYMDFYYEFENVTLPDNATQMVVMWKGEWTDHDETVYMYLWNWNTSTWDLMPNRIAWYTNMISNTIENESISCYLHPNGTVRVRFTDSDVTSDKGYLRTDLLEVQLHYAIYGSIEMMRGGGEVHIYDPSLIALNKFQAEDFFFEKKIWNHDYCIDNTTLRKEIRIERCGIIGGEEVCYNYTKYEDIVCDFGCDPKNNRCNPRPFERIWVLVIFILLMILFIIISRKFPYRWRP